MIATRCASLRERMRQRPTLPCKADGEAISVEEVGGGVRLPLYSCPFKHEDGSPCNYFTHKRTHFLRHIAAGASDSTHETMLRKICRSDHPWLTNLDYVYAAAAIAERERWPQLGLSTTRRSLNLLCERFNDNRTKCLACFFCGQLRATCEGYPYVDLKKLAD